MATPDSPSSHTSRHQGAHHHARLLDRLVSQPNLSTTGPGSALAGLTARATPCARSRSPRTADPGRQSGGKIPRTGRSRRTQATMVVAAGQGWPRRPRATAYCSGSISGAENWITIQGRDGGGTNSRLTRMDWGSMESSRKSTLCAQEVAPGSCAVSAAVCRLRWRRPRPGRTSSSRRSGGLQDRRRVCVPGGCSAGACGRLPRR